MSLDPERMLYWASRVEAAQAWDHYKISPYDDAAASEAWDGPGAGEPLGYGPYIGTDDGGELC